MRLLRLRPKSMTCRSEQRPGNSRAGEPSGRQISARTPHRWGAGVVVSGRPRPSPAAAKCVRGVRADASVRPHGRGERTVARI